MPPSGAAEVGIEAIFSRVFGEVPLSGDAGLIAFCFESLSDRGEFLVKNSGVLSWNELAVARLSTVGISNGENAMTWAVTSCHEAGSGWSAVCSSGVGLGEVHAFFSETVDIWGLVVSGALAGEVSVAEVIRVNEDDVGSACFESYK